MSDVVAQAAAIEHDEVQGVVLRKPVGRHSIPGLQANEEGTMISNRIASQGIRCALSKFVEQGKVSQALADATVAYVEALENEVGDVPVSLGAGVTMITSSVARRAYDLKLQAEEAEHASLDDGQQDVAKVQEITGTDDNARVRVA